jgi:hypothetical protein
VGSTLTLAVVETEAGQDRLQGCTGVLGYNRESGRIVPLWIPSGVHSSPGEVVTILVSNSDELERAIAAIERANCQLV